MLSLVSPLKGLRVGWKEKAVVEENEGDCGPTKSTKKQSCILSEDEALATHC